MLGSFIDRTRHWSLSSSDVQEQSLKALEDEALCAPIVLTWTSAEGSTHLGAQALALATIPALKQWFPIGGLVDVSFTAVKSGSSVIAAHLPIPIYCARSGSVDETASATTIRVLQKLQQALRRSGNKGSLCWAPAERGAGCAVAPVDEFSWNRTPLPILGESVLYDNNGFGNFYMVERNRVPVTQRNWKLRFVDTAAP